MTAVLGVPCIDGVLIAADSQHSSNWYKENKSKLRLHIGRRNYAIAFSASGNDLYIDNAWQDIGKGLNSSENSLQELASSLETTMLEFHDKRFSRWSSFAPTDRPDFPDILLGVGMNGESALYRSSGTAFTRVLSPVVLGAGVLFGGALAEKLCGFTTVDKAVPIAVYILHQIKTRTAECGGYTNICAIRKDKTVSYVDDESIDRMEASFEDVDKKANLALREELSKNTFSPELMLNYSVSMIKQIMPVDEKEKERWKELDKKRKPEDRSCLS